MGSDTNPMLICVWYLFDPKVTRSLGSSLGPQDYSNSECSAITYFSMSLAHKYVNLKYNQDIKEQVTTKIFLKKRQPLHEIPTPEVSCV